MITNLKSNKIYIGYTSSFIRRRKEHFNTNYRKASLKVFSSHLYNSMERHGNENFTMILIDTYKDQKTAAAAEIEIIKSCKNYKIKLYNLTDGGDGARNVIHTETHKYCFNCKTMKEYDKFAKSKDRNLGYDAYCKKCVSEIGRIRRNGSIKYIKKGMELNDEFNKYCYKCDTLKIKSEFNKNKDKKDGLSSECKLCASEIWAEEALINKNEREKIINEKINSKEKICSQCEVEKPKNSIFWHKNKASVDGWCAACKECIKENGKTQREINKQNIKTNFNENIVKKCSSCNEFLPLTPDFWHKDKCKSNGLDGTCKICRNKNTKNRRKDRKMVQCLD